MKKITFSSKYNKYGNRESLVADEFPNETLFTTALLAVADSDILRTHIIIDVDNGLATYQVHSYGSSGDALAAHLIKLERRDV